MTVARWEAIRARGRMRFILLDGVVKRGLAEGIFWSIGMSAFEGWNRLPFFLTIALIVSPFGGYLSGAWTWKRTERAYLKLK
jgi:hypothetical protein